MNPNSYFVKPTGKVNIPKPLELGGGYKLVLDGEVISATDYNLQDGTFDRTFMFRPALCEIHDEHGQVIRAKDTRSRSQQIKRILYKLWLECGDERTADEAYEDTMKLIISKIGELYEEAKEN